MMSYQMCIYHPPGHPKTVLCLLLFVLHTNECQSQHEGHYIIKFDDDLVIVSLLSVDASVYGPVATEFTDWCLLRILKKNPTVTSNEAIDNQVVETVKTYKYLGSVTDDKLTFEPQVETLCWKVHQQMYFLRKLRNVNIDGTFMLMFYPC